MDVTSAGGGPYAGSRPFGSGDRGLFFGRAVEADDLARLWLGREITILYGDSGVGKTSLLQAGVIPLLGTWDAVVMPVGRVSYRSPFPSAALPEQNPYTFALLSSWSPADSPTHLSGMTISDALRRHDASGRFGGRLPMLVAIDQAERLFRAPRSQRRWHDRLVQELRDALRDRANLRLLISVRTDRLEAAQAVARKISDRPPALLRLGPLEPAGALEAVTRPAERKGRLFEPAAARLLVDDLRTVHPGDEPGPTVEPVLLQAVCAALWDALPPDAHSITRDTVDRSGQADWALADFAARALAEVAAAHHLPFERLTEWLLGVAGGGQPGGLPAAAKRALEDRHLVKARRDGRHLLLHARLAEPVRRLADTPRPVVRLSPETYLNAAQSALADDEFELARWQAEAAIRASDPADMRLRANARSLLGNIAYARGGLAEAAGHYQAAAELAEALQDTQAVGRLLAAVGRIKLLQGELGAAMEQLNAAVNRLPNDPAVQTGLGQALYYTGQADAALGVLGGVLTRDGDTPIALQARGEILADLGEAESALRDLNRVGHLADPPARAARALALAELADFDAAQRVLEGVDDGEDSGPFLLRAARVHKLSGHEDTAVDLAKRAIGAKHPPLPSHQQTEARRLVDGV